MPGRFSQRLNEWKRQGEGFQAQKEYWDAVKAERERKAQEPTEVVAQTAEAKQVSDKANDTPHERAIREKAEPLENTFGKEVKLNKLVDDDSNGEVSKNEAALRDAEIEKIRQAGVDVVTDNESAQRVLDMANGGRQMSKKKRRALETASSSLDKRYQPTVVSSADGAKVLKELDLTIEKYNNLSNRSKNRSKTFIGDVASALNAEQKGSSSQYATFETKNGKIVTIRLANHNAKVSTFDKREEDDGISIVITANKNDGITNDGNAHIVEYFYDAITLRRAEGKPLVDIVRSIKQSLYSGEFRDTTGLAQRQEVNGDEVIRFQRVFHGSGADYDSFDFSHLWADALRMKNQTEWKNVVELMKGTSIWDDVRQQYPELETDDEMADEVLAQYSGSRGAERLRAEQERVLNSGATVEELVISSRCLSRT